MKPLPYNRLDLLLAFCNVLLFCGVVWLVAHDDPPVRLVSSAEASPEPEESAEVEPSRAECVPCAGEGFICGKRCSNCQGYGSVPIRRLTLYPEKEESSDPDCQVKIFSSIKNHD